MQTQLQYYLNKLMQECSEVSIEASKSIMFGLDSQNPKEPGVLNYDRINNELRDVIAVARTLEEMTGGLIHLPGSDLASLQDIARVQQKTERFRKCSEELGFTQENLPNG